MELILKTNLEQELPAVIDFNYEALEAWLTEGLKRYQNRVVTEDTLKECKEDRAQLNALKTTIENERKRIKAICLKPYDDFEVKIKKLTALIDEPIKVIDTQTKAFEENRKEEKMTAIKQIYEILVPDNLKDIIPLNRIADPKWLNATVTIKKINEALKEITKRTESDLAALNTVAPEHAAAVRAKYIETLDIAAAIQYQTELQKAAEAFRQREAEKENKQPAEAPKAAPKAEIEETETLYSLRLEFQLTKGQATALKSFLSQQGISYRKI